MLQSTAAFTCAAVLTILTGTVSLADSRCEPGWVLNANVCEPMQSVGIVAKRRGDTLDLGGGYRVTLRSDQKGLGYNMVYKQVEGRSVMVIPYEMFLEMNLDQQFNAPAAQFWQ